MSKTRRIAAMTMAATAAAGLAAVTTGAPAAAAARGPHLITEWTRPVAPGTATWVDLYWKTGKPVCDAEVRLSGKDVEVTYPANTDTYSSFSKSADLKAGKTDRTAFRVTAAYDKSVVVPLEAKLTYHTCGKDAVEKVKKFPVKLTVVAGVEF
ncbi:hypothetical protein [Actinoplanes sp. NPDC051494]|uniref:hypothetical protein n=1 Tax=Actinoplanes sp. NPDC051494 TaxID=3363907 RepID=UPI00378F2138